jgi:hypothetical protein
MFTSVEDEATDIAVLARSRLPLLLRQLGAATSEHRRKDLWWRIKHGVFGRDEEAERKAEIDAASLKLAALAEELNLKIEQFLPVASFAGSPPAYQQDLRESRLALVRLLLDEGEGAKSHLDLETFRTLSHIVDLVELARRDVQRRVLDDPLIATRFVVGHLPAGNPDEIAEILGVEVSNLGEERDLPSSVIRRVRLVAQLIYDLRSSHTPEGLLDWFHQPFPELGDRSALDVLDEPSLESQLRSYARSLRSQIAT